MLDNPIIICLLGNEESKITYRSLFWIFHSQNQRTRLDKNTQLYEYDSISDSDQNNNYDENHDSKSDNNSDSEGLSED